MLGLVVIVVQSFHAAINPFKEPYYDVFQFNGKINVWIYAFSVDNFSIHVRTEPLLRELTCSCSRPGSSGGAFGLVHLPPPLDTIQKYKKYFIKPYFAQNKAENMYHWHNYYCHLSIINHVVRIPAVILITCCDITLVS